MAALNRCQFIGNIGKIETRYMASGEAVVNFSLAVNESYKNKEGDKVEKVEWVNAVAYKKLAEIMSEYVKVGSSVYIEGRLQTRKWVDKENQERYTTEIIADRMQMLGGRKDAEDSKPVSNNQNDFDAEEGRGPF